MRKQLKSDNKKNGSEKTTEKKVRQKAASKARGTTAVGRSLFLELPSCPYGVLELDLTGKIVSWNSTAKKIFGYTAAQAVGQSWTLIVPEHEQERIRKGLKKVLRATDGYRTSNDNVARDGRIIHCEWYNSPLTDEQGEPIGVLSIVEDVTEKKRMEIALRESERRFRAITENSPLPMIVSNAEGRLLYANPGFKEMFGIKAEKLGEVLTPSLYLDKSSRERLLRELAEKQIVQSFDTQMYGPNGETLDLQLSVHAIEYNGAPAYVAALIDCTERRRTEEMIARQKDQIAQSSKMSALGQMAAGMAHEINNPLQIVHGHAIHLQSLAMNQKLDHNKVLTAASMIESTSLRIAKIVKGLRSFARDGDLDEFVGVPLKSVIDDTLEFCRRRLGENGVVLEVAEIPSSVRIECRPSQLSQVLLNLLNNAFDAVEELPKKWIRIDTEVAREEVSLCITDSGSGIPMEIRDKLMQPFFTTKSIGRGTGLGLSIAKGIVEDHGGRIEVDHQHRNTCFRVVLPRL